MIKQRIEFSVIALWLYSNVNSVMSDCLAEWRRMKRRRKSRTRLPYQLRWSCGGSPPPSPTALRPGRVPQCSTRSLKRRESPTMTSTWMRVCRPNSAVSKWTWPGTPALWARRRPRDPRRSAIIGARVREGDRHARALRRAMMTPRATGGAWIKTQASATAGTGGTAVKGHLAARGGTVEAAAQGRGSPPLREEGPLAQTGGVLEREVTGEDRVAVEEGGVGEEEGVIKDKTALPVVVTTVALLTRPLALSPGPRALQAAALSWWRVSSWWACASAHSCSTTTLGEVVEGVGGNSS